MDVQPENQLGSKMTGMFSSFTNLLSAAVSSSPSTFVLESTAGFHRGVRLELEPGDIRIGSTPGADIVLRDAGIAAEHAVLRVGHRTIDLHAIGGEVRVGENDCEWLWLRTAGADSFWTIGEARLRISIERTEAAATTAGETGKSAARPRFSTSLMGRRRALDRGSGVGAGRHASCREGATTCTIARGSKHRHRHRATKIPHPGCRIEDDGQFPRGRLGSVIRALLVVAEPGISGARGDFAELNGCDRQPSPTLAAALNGTAPF